MKNYAMNLYELIKVTKIRLGAIEAVSNNTDKRILYIPPLELKKNIIHISGSEQVIKDTYFKVIDIMDYKKPSLTLKLESIIDTGLGDIISLEVDTSCIIR